MKLIVFILSLFAFLISCNDKSNHNEKIDNNSGIDIFEERQSQQGLNITAYENFLKADSLLNYNFEKKVDRYDIFINEQVEFNKTFNEENVDYLNSLIAEKNALLDLQESFFIYRKSLEELISLQYSSGTMAPMAIYIFSKKLTISHNEIIKEL